ncbi:hypothetical protein [Actinopolymorpha rutila]|uniref:Chloramphenicol 3-O-phosphotransferase n=1 Tax=Actinopolymorpha rutila TaxID=446787 RepID=A0A852ZA79_9ACTN|nr:hypothetical protein [Actinopolymorpha rutila]NYH88658.1 chloramphenicol 3-O-phosphotransferase [Actinopolymorpha rutila]
MRAVLLGGAPGIGKSTVARSLLNLAQAGPELLQWVDVDSLWLHQPWRVDERMKTLVQENLRSVADHAAHAGVDVLVVTWVFQSVEMQRLVSTLLPPESKATSVQLHAGREVWARRFEADPERPSVNDFYRSRYASAQGTPADHVVETDGLTPMEVARRVAVVANLSGNI